MAKHVGMDREWHLGGLPDALDEAVVTPDWMHTGNAVLDPVNVQPALGQLNLVPLQVAHLGGPQAMTVGDQDHGRIAVPVAAMLAGAVHQPVDLAFAAWPSPDGNASTSSARTCASPPGGGRAKIEKFIQAPSPEIWSETISGGDEVLAR